MPAPAQMTDANTNDSLQLNNAISKQPPSTNLSLVDPTDTSYSQLAQRAKELMRKSADAQQLNLSQMGGTEQPQLEPMYQVAPKVNTPWGSMGNMINPKTGKTAQQELVESYPTLLQLTNQHISKAMTKLEGVKPGLGRLAAMMLMGAKGYDAQAAANAKGEVNLSQDYLKQADQVGKLLLGLPNDEINAVHNYMGDLHAAGQNAIELAKLRQAAMEYTRTGQTAEANQARANLALAQERENANKAGLQQAQADLARAQASAALQGNELGKPKQQIDLMKSEIEHNKALTKAEQEAKDTDEKRDTRKAANQLKLKDIDRAESRLDSIQKKYDTLVQKQSGLDPQEDKDAYANMGKQIESAKEEIQAAKDNVTTARSKYEGGETKTQPEGDVMAQKKRQLHSVFMDSKKSQTERDRAHSEYMALGGK